MSFVPDPMVAGDSNEHCNCVGPCTGYSTRSNCPPLIVLAVLVSEAANFAHTPVVTHEA
jgi:predicted metal-binding protein